MTVFIIRRLAQSLFVLFITSVIVFTGIFAIGNPIDILIAADATQAEREQAIWLLGLDQSLLEQYGTFIWHALHGDLGAPSCSTSHPSTSSSWAHAGHP